MKCGGLSLFAAIAFAVMCASQGLCQDYPTRAVHLLSGNPPGGPSDLALRAVAAVLSKKLGQPFIVENKPGAEGLLMGEQCARAPRDGYTFCLGDPYSMTLNSLVRTTMPYDPFKEISPIVHIGFLPSGFWVNRSVETETIQDFTKYAREASKPLNFASFGTSSSIYLGYFEKAEGMRFTEVPYKSAFDAWRAVLTNESQVSVYGLRSGQAQASGSVRLLAVNTDQRLPDLPDVPTLNESGFKISMIVWFGLFAPAGTPDRIIDKINTIVGSALREDSELQGRLRSLGMFAYGPTGKSAHDFADFYIAEKDRYRKLVELGGLK